REPGRARPPARLSQARARRLPVQCRRYGSLREARLSYGGDLPRAGPARRQVDRHRHHGAALVGRSPSTPAAPSPSTLRGSDRIRRMSGTSREIAKNIMDRSQVASSGGKSENRAPVPALIESSVPTYALSG